MKKTIKHTHWKLFTALFALLMTAALALPAGTSKGEAPSPTPPSGEFTLRYAEGFTVEAHEGYKVVTVLSPWRDAEHSVEYVLVERGTSPPASVGAAHVIEVPVRSAVSLATTHLPHLDRLDVLDVLVGIGETDYVNTTAVIERIDAGQIVEVGRKANVNIEGVFALDPDVIFTLAVGLSHRDNHPQLLEAGFNVVLVSDYLETTPLGRAEWIKFFALFFGKEAEAAAIFDDIATQYEQMAALADSVADRPTTFMGFFNNSAWYVPGGDSFYARYLADAGADYVWTDDDSTGRMPFDFEAVYERAGDADYWLNLSQSWIAPADILAADARYGRFLAFREGRVYNHNARLNAGGGNDFNEGGHANPHIVLADLIHIFHPELLPDHALVYYRHIDTSRGERP